MLDVHGPMVLRLIVATASARFWVTVKSVSMTVILTDLWPAATPTRAS